MKHINITRQGVRVAIGVPCPLTSENGVLLSNTTYLTWQHGVVFCIHVRAMSARVWRGNVYTAAFQSPSMRLISKLDE